MPDLIDQAAETLTAEEGFQEAFHRLSGLPVMLPKSLLSAYGKLSQNERTRWQSAVAQLGCPITNFHFIRVLLTLPPAASDGVNAKDLTHRLFSGEAEKSYVAFNRILRWTVIQIQEARDAHRYNSAALLAISWSHASRIYNLLKRSGTDEHIFWNLFEKLGQPSPEEPHLEHGLN